MAKLLIYELICFVWMILAGLCVAINDNFAIVALIRGLPSSSQYEKYIKPRNQAIHRYLYSQNLTQGRTDVIIFHEGDIDTSQQTYIQSYTPQMPLLFVNVSSVFLQFAGRKFNNPRCASNKDSEGYSVGYKTMCYFWFIAFQEYLGDYDFMFRVDDDCILLSDVRLLLQERHIGQTYPGSEKALVHFASVSWLDLSQDNEDQVSAKDDRPIVKGLYNLTASFQQTYYTKNNKDNHSLPLPSLPPLQPWLAPYTNLMLVNLVWLRSCAIVQAYLRHVQRSHCIHSNRWGDLPLWGGALLLAGQRKEELKGLAYIHGSHKRRFYYNAKGQLVSDKKLTPL